MVIIIYVLIPSKVYQKRKFVKLKSVQTLLRIDCVADRKSYVVIIFAASLSPAFSTLTENLKKHFQ